MYAGFFSGSQSGFLVSKLDSNLVLRTHFIWLGACEEKSDSIPVSELLAVAGERALGGVGRLRGRKRRGGTIQRLQPSWNFRRTQNTHNFFEKKQRPMIRVLVIRNPPSLGKFCSIQRSES